ncbi:MAG: PAS domain S-box protein, partial [Candidatus Scalindua sp.]
ALLKIFIPLFGSGLARLGSYPSGEEAIGMSMFRSIKIRLLVFGLGISLIPISIITTIYYLNARGTLKNQILQDFKAIAESKKTHIISIMHAKKIRAVDFSSDGFIRDSLEIIIQSGGDGDAVVNLNKHLTDNKMPLDPHIAVIDVVGVDGTVISSTTEMLIGQKLSDNENFQQLGNGAYGDAYIKEPCYSPLHSRLEIVASAPLFLRSGGRFIGSIMIHYDSSVLNSITNDHAGMGETGEVYIVNRDKKMLTVSRFVENAVLNQVVDTEPMRRISEGSNNEMMGIYSGYRGVQVVGVSVNIPEYGWTLLVEMDKAEALAPLKGLGIIVLIVGGVSGAAATGVGIIFSLSTAKPINKLKDATDRVANGNLKHRVDIDRRDEIGALAGSFNKMADGLEQLTGSLEQRVDERTSELADANRQLRKLSCAVEQSPSLIMITNVEGDIEYVNPKFPQFTGYSAKEVIGKNPRILKSGKTTPQEYKYLWNTIKSGREWYGEFCNKKKNGELYWESASISPIRNSKGVITHFVAVKEDITERKEMEEKLKLFNKQLEQSVAERTGELSRRNRELQAQISERRKAEERIKTSLKEKVILLREIHHRVKNNLQIISSLLDMSSMQTQNQEAIDLFADSRNRVNAMSLIHSQLYRSERFDHIDMEKHIQELTRYLLQIYAMEKTIELDINSTGMYFDIEQAIPCALILNELITNICKHAYREGQKGRVSITMQKQGGDTVLLRVKDDGVGIPEGFNIEEVKSLGLSLVRNLVYKQLKGRIKVKKMNMDTEFLVNFKVSKGTEV